MNTAERFKNFLFTTTPDGVQPREAFKPIIDGACEAFDAEIIGTYNAENIHAYFFFFRDNSAIRLKGHVVDLETGMGTINTTTFEFEPEGQGELGPRVGIPTDLLT